MYQDNYGLVDVEINCSDGKTYRSTNNKNGQWNNWMICNCLPCCSDKGFDRIGVNYQNNYGLVNARTDCGLSNGNENGKWEKDLICPCGQKMIGVQVNYQDGYGIVNVQIQCASS